MPRGISRINNYYNRIEAWKDWAKIAQQAEDAGREDLAIKYAPDGDSGWRTIDKAIAAVRAELKKTGATRLDFRMHLTHVLERATRRNSRGTKGSSR